ncbi:S9 family peptidase [Actimicrobium antarcticum]|uniref:S9 family peptidase n=1 Tax=Actimicrobium antarcticum TaxID=1051899 RepID=UPI0031D3E924
MNHLLPQPLRTVTLAATLLMACLSASAHTGPEDVIAPNPHLTAEGIPPIPAAMAQLAGRYNDFRSRVLLDWHPTRREMLVATRTSGVGVQVHLLRKPMGELEQLTDYPDPVRAAWFEPKNGSYILFEKDEGGSEASQLFRMDLATRKVTLLTDPNEKHGAGEWNHAKDRVLVYSTQLDKTAGAARRADVTTELWLLDPLQPGAKRKIASLPGGGWSEVPAQWSRDDRQLVATNFVSANESTVWLIDVASGARRQILPAPGAVSVPVFYGEVHFSRDDKSLLATSDAAGEFQQLVRIDLATRKQTILSKKIAWDVTHVEPASLNDRVATVVNNDGMSELHLFDAAHGRELPHPALPSGAVSRIKWRTADELGLSLNSARSPGEVMTLNLRTGATEQWTAPTAGIDTGSFRDAAIVRWKSFDNRMISGIMSRPEARADGKFKGPRPVVIQIHGGPESQARLGFLGRINYLVNELGIAVIQPNVRGSTGYGKSFLKLDNGMLREDSVKDIGALLDWIATQPDLDPTRVVVMGGSYGGYMSLAVSTNYADRITGSVDVVGISSFVSFLERTESYRRDLRRVEYGDERDPAMRAFMERIAPLNNAQKITKPLFVVQGKNDPRVPLNEAEQIVERVRKNGVPVWYLMADNEGHGFARKPNADFYFFSLVRFLEEYLLR